MSDEPRKAKKPKPAVPFDYRLVEPIPPKNKDAEPIAVVKVERRPRLKDLKAIAGKGNLDSLGITLSRITDLPAQATRAGYTTQQLIDELDVEDVQGLDNALSPFYEEDEAETSPVSSESAPAM